MTETNPPKKSDLPARTLSAIVMVAVAGTALWLGGWVWTAFVALVALGVLWEWRGLTSRLGRSNAKLAIWTIIGVSYVGLGAVCLVRLRTSLPDGFEVTGLVLAMVIATDIGAYFAGRTFGGPKIAPKISPSKTWSGLVGGGLGAGITYFILSGSVCYSTHTLSPTWSECLWRNFDFFEVAGSLVMGTLTAIISQTGDFFESWLKRRAGVKDSGNLIPGHGGLFDRVDGLLAVCFVIGLFVLLTVGSTLTSIGSLLPAPA